MCVCVKSGMMFRQERAGRRGPELQRYGAAAGRGPSEGAALRRGCVGRRDGELAGGRRMGPAAGMKKRGNRRAVHGSQAKFWSGLGF